MGEPAADPPGLEKKVGSKPLEKAAEKAKPTEAAADSPGSEKKADSKPVEKAVEKAKPKEAAEPVLFGTINNRTMNQTLSRLRGPPSFSKRVESKPAEKAAEE